MPFVHDDSEVEWLEDGTQPEPPRPDEFVYIPAPQFGGAPEPVRFDVQPPDGPTQQTAPEHLQESNDARPTQASAMQRQGFWGRVLSRFGGGGEELRRQRLEEFALQRRRAEQKAAQQDGRMLSIMVPALREIGGRRIYCRYDGGHDEGFAWFDNLELEAGERIGADVLAQRLHEAGVIERLREAGVALHYYDSGASTEQESLKFFVDGHLSNTWASMLLGRSFGTGEYSMYGAFTVDLETGTISDDSAADPVVQNIRVAQ